MPNGKVKRYETALGNNILDAQLNISCDHLVNKILYYLTNLPRQYSYYALTPKFKDLVGYSRFEGYLNKWFD